MPRQDQVEQTAMDYFATFAERKDWDKLCSFYRDDLEFDDVILQIHLDSLWKFKRFYKWDEEGDAFQKLSPEQDHLTLYSLLVNDSTAVAQGRVNPFYYHGTRMDFKWGMNFTIWLYFDQDLKIRKQVDWFEYSPETLENVVKRCSENGHEVIPDWLDLSK
ncbi:MAG: hypothetical protein P1U56_26640 [Saprospiraceae bacterium]|nr:hypothetical protein [Saprospiraceae bacterium]